MCVGPNLSGPTRTGTCGADSQCTHRHSHSSVFLLGRMCHSSLLDTGSSSTVEM